MAFDGGRLAGPLRLLWNLVILPLKLRNSNVQAVVSQNTEGSIWCTIPQLLIVHDLIPLLYPEEAPRLRHYYKRVLPRVLKRTASVIVVSKHTQDELLKYYKLDPDWVHIAYNGVDRSLEETRCEKIPASFPIGPYFLFVGTFSPRKNLETVIRALARVRDQVRESLLIVAYPDRWTNRRLELSREMGLSDRVVHLSDLTDQELAYAYGHATALFLLSEYEGFGLPPLEAMLTGTPAVVSDSTALAEGVGDAGIKISAHDIDGAAEAMVRLSNDHAYREGLRESGLQRAQGFTWARAGCGVSEVLAQVVHSDDSRERRVSSPQ